MLDVEPMLLHLGRKVPHKKGAEFPILNEDDVEVGFVVDSVDEGRYSAMLYDTTTLGFTSYRQEELLTVCGLWLAYQKKSIKLV